MGFGFEQHHAFQLESISPGENPVHQLGGSEFGNVQARLPKPVSSESAKNPENSKNIIFAIPAAAAAAPVKPNMAAVRAMIKNTVAQFMISLPPS